MQARTVTIDSREASVTGRVPFGHIRELDIIRALGSLLVVCTHLWPINSYRVWLGLQLGWMVMDAFFVLSGFLITGILLDSRAKPDYFRSFYLRRTLRIFPIYYLVIATLTVCGWLFDPAAMAKMKATWGSVAWFFAYLGNIPSALKGDWPYPAGFGFVPLWSLQVEEQFYLLFPLLVYKVQTRTLRRVLWALAATSVLLRIAIWVWAPHNKLAQYVLLPCRMEGLAFGALLAIRYRCETVSVSKMRLSIKALLWTAVAVGAAICAGFEHTRPFNRTIGILLSSIASYYVVMWLIEFRGSAVTAWTRVGIMQHLSNSSYALYMIHFPIAAVLGVMAPRLLGGGFGRWIGGLIVANIVAALSWNYIEKPILGLRERFSKPGPMS